ncbi:acid phosphatase [Cordyceps fumosorosea ARSEF 2679]|uniref:Acid phosphatase n=1 Tax=Cordyceps fumosorosea (strain ARSEF 2679) TaxID=1081104 RepID=A0A168DA85_CORFA|nr:acid phosphatase [Cordyceps fumosorosea ARSEF 2679]OAA72351.1 acid phosphatase [Cordyceps fumosorosea ARSEF 2679]
MRISLTLALAFQATRVVEGIRIVQGTREGWADLYARSFGDHLRESGHDVVLSAPAEKPPYDDPKEKGPVFRKRPCQYNSCLPMSGAAGRNASRPELNWVNASPVTALKTGIDTFGPERWNGSDAEFVVSGVNVGSALFFGVQWSGTVGAAVYAARRGLPAIAFSGLVKNRELPWNTYPEPTVSRVYAGLAAKLTNALIDSGKPYLPRGVWLNVNFPDVDENCLNVDDFNFVLTRITPGWFSPRDVKTCGRTRLPTEMRVYKKSKEGLCYVSVSVGDAQDKTTMNDVRKQKMVLEKLGDLLSCLPNPTEASDHS